MQASADSTSGETPHTPAQRWRVLFALQRWMAFPLAILSGIWLVIAILDLTGNSNPVLSTVALVIWVIFIIEFAISLTIAPDKPRYLRRNFLTLISLVVPALRLFRALAVLRAASILRGANLVRIVGVINRSMGSLRKTMRRRAVAYVLALTAAVLTAGAAGMYSLEPASEVPGGFTSYWDALWWTGMLLTSIGSQFWPQTQEGRVLGFLLALYGLGMAYAELRPRKEAKENLELFLSKAGDARPDLIKAARDTVARMADVI